MPERTAPPAPEAPASARSHTSRLVSASALMAAGTALSRVMGFFRLMLLVVLFGNGTRQAEMFTLANTVPNSMYILLAGGVLNTVLVPQIVRAVKHDKDAGEAYTNRVMTAGLIGLGLITVLLVLAVPVVIWLYSAGAWKDPQLAAQYDSMVALGYYCMPQVFFYGVYVLAGQVLNSRDRFGPMMWAPIANNVVSIGVLLLFLGVFGRTGTAGAFTPGQELLLGLGSTLGIAVQALVLLPFLRASGYRFRPRLDFRGTGLGKTFRLAKWTLGFVLVNQLALVVVSRLASGATVGGRGAGLTAYANAYAVWILPHSLITVSLATAMLPAASRLAAAGDLRGVAEETMRTMRLAVTALLPAAVALLVLGLPVAHLFFGFGAGARDSGFVGIALMALAVGLTPFTLHYICLRAFYALENTRTTFLLQCVIAATNVVLAVLAVYLLDQPGLVALGLASAYSLAYLLGVVLAFRRLRRTLPDLDAAELLRHCVRLLLAVIPAAAAAFGVCWLALAVLPGKAGLIAGLAVGGLLAVALFALLARMLRIAEVTDIAATLLRRRRRTEPAAAPTDEDRADASRAAGNDLLEPGDSATVKPPSSLSIERTAAAPEESSEPGGPRENAEHMAQATIAQDLDPEGAQAAPDSPPGTPEAEAPAAATLPAGTVLASRYRLEELIAESRPTVTWRAFDQVLSRSVLVHVLSPGDPGEADLLAAARRASVATDSRFLRVLDAVHSTDPALGSYIVCEYATGQSLELILSHGALSGLEAAWVVREVADALAGVHALGLYHRRINPETVIVTPTGNIKIVGLLIEAALRPVRGAAFPGAGTPEAVDVADLGRLLYAALVCRWPGGPAYGLSDAPAAGHRWMTPRQVRAGVSPALDNVCDQILGDPPRHRAEQITTAAGIVTALTKVLGPADASGDLERRLRQPVPRLGRHPERVDPATGAPPVSALLDDPDAWSAQATRTMPASSAPPTVRRRLPEPGPAGTAGDPSAQRAPQTSPVRPAPQSSPVRRPQSSSVRRPPQSSTVRRRPQRWIGALLLLAVLLIAAGIVAAVVLDQRLPTAGGEPSTAPSGAAPSATPGPVKIVAGRDFDPQGDDQRENSRQVPLAFDGKPTTRWQTVTYLGSPELGKIKRGVGLVLDLGSAQTVSKVDVTLSGTGTSVQLRVPEGDAAAVTKPPMSSDAQWRTVAKQSNAGSRASLTPERAVTTRYVLVYLTSLPKEGKGYRGGIYEVEVA